MDHPPSNETTNLAKGGVEQPLIYRIIKFQVI